MKALFMTREYPPNVYGGAGVHVEYLTRELAELIEIDVKCFGDQQSQNNNLKVTGFPDSKEMFAGNDSKAKAALMALQTCLKFNADPITADVVHCHTWYSYWGGILAKIAYGTPLIITVHSLEPLRPWKREQLGRGYDLSSWVEKTAIEMADRVVAVSEGSKQEILEHFEVSEDRLQVIHNGIDANEYVRLQTIDGLEKYGVDTNSPYVLFVGRITRQKGIIHLVNAIPDIDPETQIVLCAGAPDTKEIAKEMEDAVNEIKKTRSNIVWISEMVDKKTAIELYSHASVFCCPSIYEPFGIINLEAMACETPVVASAVGGIVEVVVPEETGYLVEFTSSHSNLEPDNPQQFSKDLATNINKLMKDKELRDKMAAAGRQRVIEKFSWKSIAAKVAELYKGLNQET